MSEKRYFKIEYDEEWYLFDSATISEQLVKEQAEYGYGVFANSLSPSEVVNWLNEQEQKIQRWKRLYELKDAEVTARVDALNRVCNYYLTETQFKAETDPNDAVKEVINEILNAPIYEE